MKARQPDPQTLLPLPVSEFQILLALADEERHGYAIRREVAERTDGEVQLGPGTLYGSIKRMVSSGLIAESDERPGPGARRRAPPLLPHHTVRPEGRGSGGTPHGAARAASRAQSACSAGRSPHDRAAAAHARFRPGVIRALLRLYPPAFRARFGREIEQLVRASWRESPDADRSAAFWASVVADLVTGAAREHDRCRSRVATRTAPAAPRSNARFARPPGNSTGRRHGYARTGLRYAWRTVRKSPGFALVVIVSLALGIGANSLIYSVVDGIVLAAVPVPERGPARLHRRDVSGVERRAAVHRGRIAARVQRHPRRARRRSSGSSRSTSATATSPAATSRSACSRRSSGAIPWRPSVVRPLLGRSFRPEETTTQGDAVAVISHRVWQSRFGGDSADRRRIHSCERPADEDRRRHAARLAAHRDRSLAAHGRRPVGDPASGAAMDGDRTPARLAPRSPQANAELKAPRRPHRTRVRARAEGIRGLAHGGRHLDERRRRRVPTYRHHSARRRRAGPADRLREHRESPPGTRDGAAT